MTRAAIGRKAALAMLGLALLTGLASLRAQDQRPLVYVAPIEGIIDLGMAPFVKRVLDEAAAAGAVAVVLEINTLGGRLDAALQIRDALLNAPLRTVAFVNKRAVSAGALVALAAENIVMAGGATIGAATPVQMGQPGAPTEAVGDKTVSYVRNEFRATAQSRQRPPLLAEAMVDADVEIAGVVDKGILLTLTTDEALKHKLIDLRADSIGAALAGLGLGTPELRRAAPDRADNVVRFLTHPVVSTLLIALAMLGIIVELRTPGLGVPGLPGLPGAVGVSSLALFFWAHWLVQLARWEEVLLAGAGIVLLVLKRLVKPGLGIAGVLGIGAIVASLVLSLAGPGYTSATLLAAGARVMFALLLALLASQVLLRLLTKAPFENLLVLERGLTATEGFASAPESDAHWLGKQGRASSPLRPAGIAEIDGQRVDVVSDGEHIDAGLAILVTRVDGNRIVVRHLTDNHKET